MEYKTATVVSCWLAVALIASVYMIVFGNSIGDIIFGVFLPVGALVLVALIVTLYVTSNHQEKTQPSIITASSIC
jgi:hypothetical protein